MPLTSAGRVATSATLLALGLSATSATAQTVSGTVLDEAAGGGLEGAMVTAVDEDRTVRGRAVTDADGRFSINLPQSGTWRFGVELLGYRSLVTPVVEVSAAEWVTLEITLATRALHMEPLVVTARRKFRNPSVQRFYERRDRADRSGFGQFVVPDDIEYGFVRRPTDLFRGMPGLRVVPGAPGRGQGVRMAGGCVPAIYVDGLHINRISTQESVDDYLGVTDIEGVEVYRGSAGNLTPYHDPGGCGLVLVWTRTEVHEPGSGLSWRRILTTLGGVTLFFFMVN